MKHINKHKPNTNQYPQILQILENKLNQTNIHRIHQQKLKKAVKSNRKDPFYLIPVCKTSQDQHTKTKIYNENILVCGDAKGKQRPCEP